MVKPKIKINKFNRAEYKKTLDMIRENNLCTVCIEANCPNRYECFSQKTATFMILGEICSRNCKYCNVNGGTPKPVDPTEPERISDAVKKMDLNFAVITCVTRDDLDDGGAKHFVDVVNAIRAKQKCGIELLISDLNGNWEALKTILDSKPDILNHNIEVVREIFPSLRPMGNYEQSLELLKQVKKTAPEQTTKSGLMVGLGETEEQIMNTLEDLYKAECEIITIGQYLQPSKEHAPVAKYYSDEEFDDLKAKALAIGFKKVEAARLVRSSYHAGETAGANGDKQ